MKNISNLKHSEARKFFLKEESYFTFDLPKYFKFSTLINALSKKLNGKSLSGYHSTYRKNGKVKMQKPEFFEGVNYKLLNNKNGEYSWRLLQLIHPALYVELVHKITEKNNWEIIVGKFKKFQSGAVECVSLPVVKSKKQKSDKVAQIIAWWKNMEQKSIILSLEYDYIFNTDIVDCYGSIYTHSIPWALHTKDEAKKPENRDNRDYIGVVIDQSLRSMANSQTNGIPQGSVLMDFIAEIVLGYIDQELAEKIKSIAKDDYKIIRYRDDYRVFVNNPEIGNKIIKELTNVLSDVGMRLNAEKTKYSNDVISGSIKSDKLFWITNGVKRWKLEKQLIALYDFSKQYPNSGTLVKELQNFYRRIEKIKSTKQNIEVLISILINIAFKNPRTYPVVSAIFSKFLVFVKDKKKLIERVKKRFQKLPNTEHLDLWLQRITLKIDDKAQFQGKLCEMVQNNSAEIWNSNWLKYDLKNIISSTNIIDRKKIKDMQPVMDAKEVSVFERKNDYY